MVLQKVLQYVQILETTFMHFVFRMVALVLRMVCADAAKCVTKFGW